MTPLGGSVSPRALEAKPNIGLLDTVWIDFKQLTKVGLSLSVVFSSLAGYLIAAPSVDLIVLLMLAIGGYLMVGASNAFNQIIEKDTDALMKRTMNRPLPAGRMHVSTALVIAVSFTVDLCFYLCFAL